MRIRFGTMLEESIPLMGPWPTAQERPTRRSRRMTWTTLDLGGQWRPAMDIRLNSRGTMLHTKLIGLLPP